MNITTIRLRKDTQERLKNIGRKIETYDDVINRLMKEEEK